MIDVGDLYPMGIIVRDVDGDPINAATVTLTIVRPDLTIVNAIVANPPGEAGHYIYDYVPTMAGRHTFRWATTSPTLVYENSFDVAVPGSAGLISLERAKRLLRIDLSDASHDDDIRSIILAATEPTENQAGRVLVRREMFETKAVTRPRMSLTLVQRPVLALTSVTDLATGTQWLPPAVTVDEHGIVRSYAGPFTGRSLRVVYVAGYQVVPEHYQEAAGIIVQHLWTNRGGSSQRPRPGGTQGDESGTTYSIPNRAKDLLGRRGPMVG